MPIIPNASRLFRKKEKLARKGISVNKKNQK
jgi:hypothetical protein